ncbi:MAG: JAB domain-containing protein [Chloroflexota bacterium]|nr:JAB domain-containing protein [Chloroflexota bacterium]
MQIINRVGVTMVVEAATQYQPTIRYLPQGERPRERLRQFGPKSLNDTELIAILLLNTRNEVLGIQEIYVGNVNSSVVRAAEVFRPAVQANAPSIIVVHNHPSGDPAPSSQDVDITNELISARKFLGIELLDHVVLGSGNRFISMNERRFAFA